MTEIKPKILLIDDHVLFLEGLRRLLADFSSEIHSSNNASDALESLAELSPDLVLIDLYMPGMDGISFIKAVEARELLIPVVVISATEDLSQIRQIIDIGAFGFIPKSIDRDGLFAALETILGGDLYVPAEIRRRLPARADRSSGSPSQHGLSDRQIEILTLLAKGYPNKKISLILFVADETVKTHLRNIFQILGVSTRTEAVAKAIELDLL